MGFAIAALVAGCVTAPTFEKDKYYPTDWPSIGGSGEDCGGINGTFENKGVLVDEKGRSQEVWFTELWVAYLDLPEDARAANARAAKVPTVVELSLSRECTRVSLKIEDFAHPARALIPDAKWQLVISPTRPSTTGPPGQFEPCESLRMPTLKQASNGGVGLCTTNSFYYRRTEHGHDEERTVAPATDGSLLVKVHRLDLFYIPYLFPFFWSDTAWARFGRLP